MSWADYNEFIQRELVPDIVDTVVYKSIDPWIAMFGTTPAEGGDRITSRYRTAWTSNATAYTKADVNPASSTQTLVKPYWTKVFHHGACEVHGIDISNNATAREASKIENMIGDALRMEVADIMDVVVSSFYTQLKKDIDSTSVAYSDASLSRSTYATLASYEEATNATITLAYMRGMIENVTANNPVALPDYVCLMENSVYHTLKKLAAALHAWNFEKPMPNENLPMGWQQMANFEGLAIGDPGDFHSMTTGDVLMMRRQDINIVVHRPLAVETVPSGRDSIKMVPRVGINIYADNPGYQGKMTDKD